MVQMYKMIISPGVFFLKFWFSGLSGAWNNDNDICRCFSLFFLKNATLQILKLFYFLLAHSTVFLIIICFSSSSINVKKKFWGVPDLLRMCVWFFHIYLWQICGNFYRNFYQSFSGTWVFSSFWTSPLSTSSRVLYLR